jgi:hypothetical protein
LSRGKEKFSLRHFTEVLKIARWMERFKNCPKRKKNFHSDILLKFFKTVRWMERLKTVQRERKIFTLIFYRSSLNGWMAGAI